MTTWCFYDPATGLLTGRTFSGPAAALVTNTPPGCHPVAGQHDHLSRRVELRPDDFGNTYPVVVPWQPPAPPDDEYQTWAWDAAIERWVSTPTAAAIARDVRAERARRVAATDWTESAGAQARLGPVRAAAFAAYRQALFDITQQAGFPHDVNWPEEP